MHTYIHTHLFISTFLIYMNTCIRIKFLFRPKIKKIFYSLKNFILLLNI